MAPDPLGEWAARGARQRGRVAERTHVQSKLAKRETKGREEGGMKTRAGKGVDGQGGGCDAGQRGRATSMRWDVVHASEGG